MGMKLLCMSGDESVGLQVDEIARDEKWSTVFIRERQEMLAAVEKFSPDLVIMNVECTSDLDWLQQHEVTSKQPVFLLKNEINEDFLVRTFECGADGAFTRAFFTRRILVARVNSFLRRQSLGGARRLVKRVGMTIDSKRHEVDVDGQALSLTLTEFRILNQLATPDDRVVSRGLIQKEVFGGSQISKRSLDVHVCSLRKKLKNYELDIESARGVGYRLRPCSR